MSHAFLSCFWRWALYCFWLEQISIALVSAFLLGLFSNVSLFIPHVFSARWPVCWFEAPHLSLREPSRPQVSPRQTNQMSGGDTLGSGYLKASCSKWLSSTSPRVFDRFGAVFQVGLQHKGNPKGKPQNGAGASFDTLPNIRGTGDSSQDRF